jgi:hypothetical protein
MSDIHAEARARICRDVWDDLIDQHAEGDLRASLLGVPKCKHLECEVLFAGPELPWQEGDWGAET